VPIPDDGIGGDAHGDKCDLPSTYPHAKPAWEGVE
jgi:hypothetical protein